MMRRATDGWAVLAAFCLAWPLAAAGSTGDAVDVRIVASLEQAPAAARLWAPHIAVCQPGRLVAAFGALIGGKTDMGDILASVSTDDGDHWSDPIVVFDHRQQQSGQQWAYANPVLYQPPGAAPLRCFAMRCPLSESHSENSRLAAATSADGGRTWTPVELTAHDAAPLIIVGSVLCISEQGAPRYLLPAHRNTLRSDRSGLREQFVLVSDDLREWRRAGAVPQPTGNRVFLHEGHLAPGDDEGAIQMVMRTSDYEREGRMLDPPRAYSSLSRDGGRTWTAAQAEPDLYNAASKGFFTRAASGQWTYVYNDGPGKSRLALRYRLRSPGGEWAAERTFYDAGTHNSYPTLAEATPGDFRAVWDSGTSERPRTHIRFGKFRPQAVQ